MSVSASAPDLRALLERARWAPSGDNVQPWRFRLLPPDRIAIQVHDTSEEVLYDYHGQATLLAAGALLETLRLAALASGWAAEVEGRETSSGRALTVTVRFSATGREPDPLHTVIETRTTHRRPLSPRQLRQADREALQAALPEGCTLIWRRRPAERWPMARLLWRNAHIRLTTPEAFPVHRDAIEWGVQESDDRIPAAAVGLDPMGLALMRWAMGSWQRVDRLNRYLGGTLLPRLQLDLLPALLCGGHFVLVAPAPPASVEDHLAAGAAVQRIWLQAARLGIQFQPTYTPIVFHRYVRASEPFTGAERPWREAQRLADRLDEELGEEVMARAVFMGRMGYGRPPRARSVRRSVEKLLLD